MYGCAGNKCQVEAWRRGKGLRKDPMGGKEKLGSPWETKIQTYNIKARTEKMRERGISLKNLQPRLSLSPEAGQSPYRVMLGLF